MPKRFMQILLSLLFFVILSFVSSLSASPNVDLFPVYDSIKSNVAFWEMVYAEYPRTKGLIHDREDLTIIYDVIDLLPPDEDGAAEENREKVKKIKEKYQTLLLALAAGRSPQSEEELRVFSLFKSNASLNHFSKAAESIRFQLCQKDHFISGVIRSGLYLEEIKKIFRSYDLPEDLAYLPHVESSFNYKAYSKFGAAGIWQFTHSTGKRFMTVDYVLDERRDPIRSTYAAARFLKENYEKLGNWPLAITAYNHGPNGMLRAKNQKGDYERILQEYKSKSFGFASRNFYAEFIAARKIASNYKEFFGELELDDPVAVYEVVMPGFAPVKDLVDYFKIDFATMREFNPALRPPVFEGRKYVPRGYRLRLPVHNQKRDFSAYVQHIMFHDQQKRSRFYRVQKGDTAGDIARSQRIKLQDLLLANGLDSRARIYEGQNLHLPIEEEKKVLLASTGSAVLKAELKKKPVTSIAKQQLPEQKATLLPTKNKVKPAAESLRVASVEKILPLPVSVPVIDQQQETVVAGTISGQGDAASGEEAEEEVLVENNISPEVVVGNLGVENVQVVNGVQRGTIRIETDETLGHIAEWLNVTASSLRRLNGLSIEVAVRLDQQLKIEFKKTSKEDFEEKRYEYHKEIEEDFFAVYKIEGARLYHIKRGDNSWTLCHDEFDLPFWLIRKYNTAHDFNNLKLDELLIIPVVGKIDAN